MAQKIPFFELFTDFSPDFDLRVPLNAAMVTNMVLEPEKRTMTLDMTVRAEMNDSTRETVEQLLARNYDLKRVDIHVKSTAEAFPDMLKNAGRKVSGSGSVIMGREIAKGRVLPISELTPKAGHVVVEGKVFKFDCHETRRAGVWTMLLEMTDYEGSLFIRRSMPEREATELLGKISVGMWLRVSGRMELSYDGKDMQLNPQDIMQIDHAERTDTAEEKRVELHLHTRMSNMDALTDTAAVVKRAIKWGMPAIAITDHGVAQSFPDAWHTGEGKIKLLYGCEGYFLNNIDDRICVHGPQDGDFSTEICCFDIETTGLKVAHDAITEIGAVILKDGEIVDTFQTFVDPERRLSPEIIGLTGITDDMLRGAPKLENALHAFLAFAGGRPLAAHNAEFDISFIRAGCKKCGIPFEPTYLDSLIFAQNLLEFAFEHFAEFGVVGLILLRDIGDGRDQLLGGEPFVDRFALLVRDAVLQFDGDGDALLERVGDLQRRDHQITHRSQQEQHERDAHRRHDVGVADLSLQSFIVFHGICRDNGKFRASLVAANRK